MVASFFKKMIWQPAFRMQSKIKDWHTRVYVIPPYEEKRNIIRRYKERFNLDVLVETGTFLGDTVEALKGDFKKLYSIELSQELAGKAAQRFAGQENIVIIQGNSGAVMKELLNKIDSPCLFWLDGHYSSEFFLNGTYIQTALGDKHTPVVEEVEAILASKHAKNHIILIDDARLFNGKNDYPDICSLKELVHNFNSEAIVEVKRDIVRIEPRLPHRQP
jgi:hypothetical protein